LNLEAIKDVERLEEFLKPSPIENAYMLGYLDPKYGDECRWYTMTDDEKRVQTLILSFDGLSRPAIFVSGKPAGVTPLLRKFKDELPDVAHARVSNALLDAVGTNYEFPKPLNLMSRMGLSRSEFHARDDGEPDDEVVTLSHRDTAAIMRTYAAWPDHFFDPYQLGSGLYFGIRGDGEDIASIAGIHTVSDRYDVAAIGNLVTHPDYRGRGYAKRCTRILLRALYERVGLVTLDVQTGNVPAIRTYQHFGFQHYAEFYEGEVEKRSS
jgi:ribosomal protein S18 acetylase RimI-like enzyme